MSLEVKVIIVDETLPLQIGSAVQTSAALNFPGENQILVNRSAWKQIADDKMKEALALHELLSLMGLEGTGQYTISQKYSRGLAPLVAGVTAASTLCPTPAANAAKLFKILVDPSTTEAQLKQFLAEKSVAVDAINEQCVTPPLVALGHRREDLFRILYDSGSIKDVNQIVNPTAPLMRQGSYYLYAVLFGSWNLISDFKGRGGRIKPLIDRKIFVEKTTELHVAATRNTAEVIQHLLESGSDPRAKDELQRDALMMAALGNEEQVVNLLLRAGCDPNNVSKVKWSALFYSAYYGNSAPVLERLVRAGSKVNLIDPEGGTPLLYTTYRGALPLTKVLVDSGANIHYVDPTQTSIMSHAIRSNSVDMVKYMLGLGLPAESPDKIPSATTHTNLTLASALANPGIIQALIDGGASVNRAEAKGATPLHAAALYASKPNIEVLIKNGAQINVGDIHGSTPLRYAVTGQNGDPSDAVRSLIDAGANIEARDNLGQTPIFGAGQAKSEFFIPMVRLLKSAGADVNAADNEGVVPLFYTAMNGSTQDVEFMVKEAGANIDSQDKKGRTAYALARFKNRPREILDLVRGKIDRARSVQPKPEKRRKPSGAKRTTQHTTRPTTRAPRDSDGGFGIPVRDSRREIILIPLAAVSHGVSAELEKSRAIARVRSLSVLSKISSYNVSGRTPS
jgi:uncharacterized protein